MFSGSNIAGDYYQEENKIKYVVQVPVALYNNDTLGKDFMDAPFLKIWQDHNSANK